MTRSRELAELASAYDSGGALGFRNRIINGDMRIDQRNDGAVVTGGFSYPVDRWFVQNISDGASTTQRSPTAPAGFINSLQVTVTSPDSALAATQFLRIEHRIEGLNLADLGWGTSSAQSVTISFWVRSSLTGTFGGAVSNSAFDRAYPFLYNIAAANTFEYKTITIPGDTVGTWLKTNGIGLSLSFSLGSGSTYSGTAGSWASTGLLSATGATNILATNGATFYITGVQLEKGSVATPFEFRSYGQELALCQRYFETGNQPFFYIASSNVYSSTAYGDVRLAVTKRAAPTITTSSWTYYSANVDAFFTPTIVRQTTDRFGYQAFSLTNWNGWPGTGTWAASAEL